MRARMLAAAAGLLLAGGRPGAAAQPVRLTASGGRVAWYRGAAHDWIAFDAVTAHGARARTDVFLVRPDGSGRRCVTCDAAGIPRGFVGQPAWHPDGEHLVIQAENARSAHRFYNHVSFGIDNDLWVVRRDGSGARRIWATPPGYAALHPHLSADGRRLAFAERVPTGRKLPQPLLRRLGPDGENQWEGWRIHLADVDLSRAGEAVLSNHRTLEPSGPGFYETHGFADQGGATRLLYSFTPGGQPYVDDCYSAALDPPGSDVRNQPAHVGGARAVFAGRAAAGVHLQPRGAVLALPAVASAGSAHGAVRAGWRGRTAGGDGRERRAAAAAGRVRLRLGPDRPPHRLPGGRGRGPLTRPRAVDRGRGARAAMTRPIESGVLSLFRLFAVLETLLLLARPLADAFRPPPAPAPSPWPGLALQVLFLGYLWSSRLRERLGALYLPAALAWALAAPLIGSAIALRLGLAAGVPATELVRLSWLTIVVLLVPIILVAWQYGFRWALWASLLASAADLASAIPLAERGGPPPATLLAIGIVRFLFFLTVAYAVARLVRAQRRQRDALQEANARLAHYAETLEELAVSQERNRLARELHDTLAHGLSAVAVQLEAMVALWESQPAEARTRLHVALQTTRAALGDARRAIADLRAKPLEDLGLPRALRELAESAAAREGLTLDLQVPEQAPRLGPAAEQAVYRIAAEALANVARHAHARRVAVRFSHEPCVSLVVADDGCGFDTAAAADGGRFGLLGMQERARAIGGALDVESAAGSGTSVRLTLRRPDGPRPDL